MLLWCDTSGTVQPTQLMSVHHNYCLSWVALQLKVHKHQNQDVPSSYNSKKKWNKKIMHIKGRKMGEQGVSAGA